MSRVGETLKAARSQSGMTQKALAKKLGVAEKYINEVEMGRKVVQENFIDKVAKVLKIDLNDISMVVTDEAIKQEEKVLQSIKKENKENKVNPKTLGETSEVWTDAFSSVLKKINIYDYKLKTTFGSKELPNYSNKVEGHPADKVLYLKIADNSMSGFRMMKDDIAFAHQVKEVSNNGFFLIEFDGERYIRQIKMIGNSRVLLVSNDGNVNTKTVELNNIKVIAKLDRIEITL